MEGKQEQEFVKTENNVYEVYAQQEESEDIFNIITTGDWREVIKFLTKDMDPWNIDLLKLNQRFESFIKRMTNNDLKIPAKILLCAAIIYRIKTERIVKQEQEVMEEESIEDDFEEDIGHSEEIEKARNINLPLINMPIIRKPVRKISIDELIGALDKALKIRANREVKEFFRMELNAYDIGQSVEELYERINNFLDKNNLVKFSELLTEKPTRLDKLRIFNSLLLLTNQQRIKCDQKELFGDIEITRMPQEEVS